jgi:hypothetical protein
VPRLIAWTVLQAGSTLPHWLFRLSEARHAGVVLPLTYPVLAPAFLRAGGGSRRTERESRWSLWFMSLFSLFGSVGFPIRQPNERDKPNKPHRPALGPANKTVQIDQINGIDQFGSPFSSGSVNNQIGAGSPFRPASPNNPYEMGWRIEESLKRDRASLAG